MCEMFFPAFEDVHDSLTTPFCNRTSYTRLKPAFLSSINSQSSAEDGSPEESSKVRLRLFKLKKFKIDSVPDIHYYGLFAS